MNLQPYLWGVRVRLTPLLKNHGSKRLDRP